MSTRAIIRTTDSTTGAYLHFGDDLNGTTTRHIQNLLDTHGHEAITRLLSTDWSVLRPHKEPNSGPVHYVPEYGDAYTIAPGAAGTYDGSMATLEYVIDPETLTVQSRRLY